MNFLQKPRFREYFILILFCFNVLIQAEQHREWRRKRRFTFAQKHYYEINSIFPTIQYCEKSEDILIVKMLILEKYSKSKDNPGLTPSVTTWSSFLSDFIFLNERLIENDPVYQELEEDFETKGYYILARFGLIAFLGLMVLQTLMSVILIPIIGFIVFRCLSIVWHMLSSRLIRKIGRKIIIRRELSIRKENRFLLPVIINKKVPKRFFKIPRFFQEYTDEEEPEVLKNFKGTIAVHLKESTSEISVQKIFGEFFKKPKDPSSKSKYSKQKPKYIQPNSDSVAGIIIGKDDDNDKPGENQPRIPRKGTGIFGNDFKSGENQKVPRRGTGAGAGLLENNKPIGAKFTKLSLDNI